MGKGTDIVCGEEHDEGKHGRLGHTEGALEGQSRCLSEEEAIALAKCETIESLYIGFCPQFLVQSS